MGRFLSKLADEQKKKKPQTWDISDVPMSMAAPKGKLPPAQQKEQDEMDNRFKHMMHKEESRRLAAQTCKRCGASVPVTFGMMMCDKCLKADAQKKDKMPAVDMKGDAQAQEQKSWVDSKGRP